MATLLLASSARAGSGHRSLVRARVIELAVVLVCLMLCLPMVHAIAGIAVPDAVDQGIATVRGFADVLRTIIAAVLAVGAWSVSRGGGADQDVAVRVRVLDRQSLATPRPEWTLLRRMAGSDDRDASDRDASGTYAPSRTPRPPRSYADGTGGSFVLRHVPAPPRRGGPVAQPGVR